LNNISRIGYILFDLIIENIEKKFGAIYQIFYSNDVYYLTLRYIFNYRVNGM